MPVSELKAKLFQLIDGFEDERLLAEVYLLLSNSPQSRKDWWDDLPDEAKNGILRGMEQHEQGQTFSHEEVRARIKGEFGF